MRNRFSWWAQAILSTISGVLLLFANSVTASISTFALVGRALALGGLGCAIASTLWTWGYARLAAKIGRSPETTPEGTVIIISTILVRPGVRLCAAPSGGSAQDLGVWDVRRRKQPS